MLAFYPRHEPEFAAAVVVIYFANWIRGGRPLGQPFYGFHALGELLYFSLGPCGLELLEDGGLGAADESGAV